MEFLRGCFDEVIAPGILSSAGDVGFAVEQFEREQVDAVILLHIACVPNGTEDNIVIDDLGARMKLIKNRWYVDARHVDLDRAEKLPQVVRLTCLQWFTVGAVVIGLIWTLAADTGKPTIAISALVLAVLFMVADYLIQRRFWC